MWSTDFRRRSLAAALAALWAVVNLSCTQLSGGAKPGGGTPGVGAEELFERLKTEQASLRYDEAAATAHELIQNYPAYAGIDEALFRAGEVAVARGRHVDAARHFEAVVTRSPMSTYRERALAGAANSYTALEMYEPAAEAWLGLLGSPADEATRADATESLRLLVREHLSSPQLESLAKKYPGSVLGREIALGAARSEYARGNYDDAYELLTNFLYQFPEGPDAVEARRLLRVASERRQAPAAGLATLTPPTNPNTIGVLLPVTGAGSLYGRYFELGVETAVAEHNAASRRPVTLVKADSKGSPVGAVRAVRRLVSEDGAIGIVGSVFTMPTVAAAIEANAWGVALLSPVVSSDDIVDIGQWVFQTRVPPEVEVTAVAELAVRKLSTTRFAVISPTLGPRRALADLFCDEVSRLGGQVVSEQYYESGATDFRSQLEAVREAAPEAIFAPGNVEELLLLVPQIKFYDLQVQLLGLSNWNSDKLLRLSRDELEGALFPLEAYRGNDPAAYARFKEAMTARGVQEISPVSEAGYFGTRLILEAIEGGAASRDEVRAFLDGELRRGAAARMAEARALSFSRVRGGLVEDFAVPSR
jgi:branched-chain amino acid transport system substrate-binding protein